jgi:beta-lactamase regulating signal transducer with metallopeptidase domain
MSALNKKNFIFVQIVAISIGLLVSLLFLAFRLYPKFIFLGQSFSNKVEEICGCSNHLIFSNHPYFYSSLIGLGLGITIFLVFGLIQILKLKIATRKFVRIKLQKKIDFSPKLKNLSLSLNLANKIIETEDKIPYIFCYGVFRPKICISSVLTRKLNRNELKTVLKHEAYHLMVYEPIKLFIVKVFSKIFFFIPGLKNLKDQYIAISELQADVWATDGFCNKAPLASAMSKILKWQEREQIKFGLALSYFSATEERVNQLVYDKTPKYKIFIPKLLASVFLLIGALIFSANLISSDKLLKAQGGGNNYCPSAGGGDTAQCYLHPQSPLCTMSYNLEEHLCQEVNQ